MQRKGGLISACSLAMLLAGVIVGGIVGLVLGGTSLNEVVLAVLCAFIAAVLALALGYVILGWRDQISLPGSVLLWNVIIASLLGGLGGHEISVDLRDPPAAPLVGALAGVLAALLIVSFAITIDMLRARLIPSGR
jgi:hypothetical protein